MASHGVELDKNRKSQIRQKLSAEILANTLDLNDSPWIDPEFSLTLPSSLLHKSGRKLTKDEQKRIGIYLQELKAHGCHPRVLYWCLQQPEPKQNFISRPVRISGDSPDDDADILENPPGTLPATREQMDGVLKKIESATEAIRYFRKELLLAAEALGDSCDLPRRVAYESMPSDPGVTEIGSDEPVDSDDAMQDLLEGLSWVKRLTRAWQAPNVTSQLESYKIISLLAYALLCATGRTAVTDDEIKKRRSKRARKTKPDRLPLNVAMSAMGLIEAYFGLRNRAEELIDKLQDFQARHAETSANLMSLLFNLDAEAKGRRSPQPSKSAKPSLS